MIVQVKFKRGADRGQSADLDFLPVLRECDVQSFFSALWICAHCLHSLAVPPAHWPQCYLNAPPPP